jgi:hypothetical protein
MAGFTVSTQFADAVSTWSGFTVSTQFADAVSFTVTVSTWSSSPHGHVPCLVGQVNPEIFEVVEFKFKVPVKIVFVFDSLKHCLIDLEEKVRAWGVTSPGIDGLLTYEHCIQDFVLFHHSLEEDVGELCSPEDRFNEDN